MKILKIVALISLFTSNALLIYFFTLDTSLQTENNLLRNTLWIIGIISFFSNIVYAIKVNVDKHLFTSLGICGLIWFYPFWVNINFGIISTCLFFIQALYILIIRKNTSN